MNGNSVQNINFILQYQSSGALYVPELTQVSLIFLSLLLHVLGPSAPAISAPY